MALSGLEIYKLLPQTNCKECGFPTCLAFAMKLAQKGTELSKCPYVTDETRASLDAAAAPPIRLVTDRRWRPGLRGRQRGRALPPREDLLPPARPDGPAAQRRRGPGRQGEDGAGVRRRARRPDPPARRRRPRAGRGRRGRLRRRRGRGRRGRRRPARLAYRRLCGAGCGGSRGRRAQAASGLRDGGDLRRGGGRGQGTRLPARRPRRRRPRLAGRRRRQGEGRRRRRSRPRPRRVVARRLPGARHPAAPPGDQEEPARHGLPAHRLRGRRDRRGGDRARLAGDRQVRRRRRARQRRSGAALPAAHAAAERLHRPAEADPGRAQALRDRRRRAPTARC